jgi:hypothetical protein
MTPTEIIGLVSGIATALAAILTALIPVINAKYRKPLQQAQLGILGINTVTEVAIKSYALHKAAYDRAKLDGNTPPAILASMAADVAKSFNELAVTTQSIIRQISKVE